MNGPNRARPLADAIDQFLAHKRALGYAARHEAYLLPKLLQYVQRSSGADLTAQSFEHWFIRLKGRHPNTRRRYYQIIYRFCCFRRRSDPDCFVPAADGAPQSQPHVSPVIVPPEQIAQLIAKASSVSPTPVSARRALVLRLAIVLLYTCGLRLGELLRLKVGDVHERGTVLHIRESKFHKSRWVPLSPSTARELQAFLRQSQASTLPPDSPLLSHGVGVHFHAYSGGRLRVVILQLFDAVGIRDEHGRRPRVHDLRHSFAVEALLRWYRNGTDVPSSLPKLAIYMGHVSIASTAYYLHWVPSLQRVASQRFEQHFGSVVKGGVR